MIPGHPNEPVRPHAIRSPNRARGRAARATHPLAHVAASGRVAYWQGMVPQAGDQGPAAVAWRREAGIDGYLNRSEREAQARRAGAALAHEFVNYQTPPEDMP